tara:strand:+ start:21687 stop:22118 length:432 start_codon:yes stop_codon:yes gene_type:complete
MTDELFMKYWTAEKSQLESFLNTKKIPLQSVVDELGNQYFNRFVSELALMRRYINHAKDAARAKDINKVGHILGTGAKVQKDNVYGVLMQAQGAQPHEQDGHIFLDMKELPKIEGNIAALRDYIMQRYDFGVQACEKILEVAA